MGTGRRRRVGQVARTRIYRARCTTRINSHEMIRIQASHEDPEAAILVTQDRADSDFLDLKSEGRSWPIKSQWCGG